MTTSGILNARLRWFFLAEQKLASSATTAVSSFFPAHQTGQRTLKFDAQSALTRLIPCLPVDPLDMHLDALHVICESHFQGLIRITKEIKYYSYIRLTHRLGPVQL